MKLYNELAEYYFSIENNHRNINDDITYIKSLIKPTEHISLLDLGCGSGEHLNLFSKSGISCTGIDSSEKMISLAGKRFPDRINFIHQDITGFDYYEEFDVATSFFGTINYLTDDEKIDKFMWNAWRALKPDGFAVFEIWNTSPVELIRKKEISHVSTTLYGDIKIERERGFETVEDSKKNLVEVNYRYRITTPQDTDILYDRHIMRTFTYDEIYEFIKSNGLKTVNVYSNFVKDPFHNRSVRMVLHLKKA